ncbi:hypothetical protein [Desulfofundulus thermosubterraneus]|uniref:Uncharacterized protein n=1 Tax=Desulfofundulus thermosubterraneus DSM 16057 TaxID=1121432 RepID=A0A1M6JFB8_9FIRM|nr:hypothetical protein [Desulfofundulus thermosubterraneus]SHJ45401.1 hypothetical protein SAMN02745219_02599 [Desulfofundulus thermosubterraneus DSM 16057]
MPKCYITKAERDEILYLTDQILSPMTPRLKTFVHAEKCYGNKCKKQCAEPKVFVGIQIQGCIPLDALEKLTEGQIAAEVEKALAELFKAPETAPDKAGAAR